MKVKEKKNKVDVFCSRAPATEREIRHFHIVGVL